VNLPDAKQEYYPLEWPVSLLYSNIVSWVSPEKAIIFRSEDEANLIVVSVS